MSIQVVLITGGLTGIGRATVAFARKGAKVVVSGRRDEAGRALAEELRSFGSEAEFINADVRKEDDVRALVDKPRLAIPISRTVRPARLALPRGRGSRRLTVNHRHGGESHETR